MPDKYFIKDGYKSQSQAITFEGDQAGSYWTDWRIRLATTNLYQYYIYYSAFSLFKARGYKKVMDLGCGLPVKMNLLFSPLNTDIVLADQPMVNEIAKQIFPQARFVPLNLENCDSDLEEKFDMIIYSDVIEHLLDPDVSLNFILRHILPGGLVIISTVERDYLHGKDCMASSKPEHVREWNSPEFHAYIQSRGFRILKHDLLPQQKINMIEYLTSRLLAPIVKTKKWSSCQMLVCEIA